MITIDYQSKLPLYEQIAKRFQTLILKGALPPDSQMPSVRSLAMDLSINPNTIQKAYSLLEQERYIYPRAYRPVLHVHRNMTDKYTSSIFYYER